MKKLVSTFKLLIVFVIIFSIINPQRVYGEDLSKINLRDASVSITKGSTASIVIQRTGNTEEIVTAYYRTVNGSAFESTHYTSQMGSVTFNKGETSKTISIKTINFNTWEKENRFFYIEIYKANGNAVIDNNNDISKITINHKDTIDQSLIGNSFGNIFTSVWATVPYLSAQYDTGAVELNYNAPKSDTGFLDLSGTTYQYFIQNNQLKYYGQIISKVANEGDDDEIKVIMYKNSTAFSSDGLSNHHDFAGNSISLNESDLKALTSIKYRYETDAQGWGDDNAHVYYRFIHWLYDTTKPSLQSFYVVGNTSEPYSDGDDIYISAKFNEIVIVSGGAPQLPVKFDDNSVLTANYVDGTGTDTLVFKITIPNNKTTNGLYIYNPSNNDSFYGEEYIKDLANNIMNSYSNTNCINTNIIIKNTIPSITSVSSDKSNVSLNNDGDVTITLNFSEPVTITGAPVLNLNNGQKASLVSGTGGLVLSADFKYNIGDVSSENTSQLYVATITDGNIVDYSGNLLTRTISVNNIKTNNIRIDNIKPSISLSENGSSIYKQVQSTNMYITDTNGSGVGEVKYVWNTSATTPADTLFIQTGGNNLPASISNSTGNVYLHIKAVDIAGNISYFNSSAYKLDNTLPSISINNNGGSICKSHTTTIDLSDAQSGVNGSFKYIWSTSTTTPSDAEFDQGLNGAENVEITKDTGNGNYYLYIRAVDISGNKNNQKSNVYIFDNISPDVITITNKDEDGNIVSNDSYQKNYNIQISAEDTNSSYIDSDIKSIKYTWSDGSQEISSASAGWTVYSDSILYNNEKLSGMKYLHIMVEDVAGNITYKTYPYTFDYAPPIIDIRSDNLTGVTNEITSNVNVSDNQNEISVFKYIWRNNNEVNITDDNWINGTITANTGIGNPTKNDASGNWYLHVYCEDIVGNFDYQVSGPYTLDVDGPTGEITIVESTIKDGSVTINIQATDNIPNNNTYYSLSQDNGVNWSDWTSLDSNTTITNYKINNMLEGITTLSVKFKDKSNNISSVYSDTVRIDLTPPTANISYDPEESNGWTSDDVVASLIDITDNLEGEVIKLNGEKYTFTDNGTYTFEIKDTVGNNTTISASVNWIDKIDPVIEEISGNQTSKKEHSGIIHATDNITENANIHLYYQWTNLSEEPAVDDLNWKNTSNGATVTKKDVDGDWYLHVKAIDEAGNEPILTSGKFVFDNTAPTGSINILEECINYNTVTLYLDSSDKESSSLEIQYSLSQDGETWDDWKNCVSIINNYTVADAEGSHQIYVKYRDKLGNESVVYSDSFIIDKTPPTAELEYSSNKTGGYINADVEVNLIEVNDDYTPKDEIKLSESSYTFTVNGEHEFSLEDSTGNVTTLTASVDWIDKEKPLITITPNSDQAAKTEHSVLIQATDNITTESNIKIYYQLSDSDVPPALDDTNFALVQNNSTVTISEGDGDWYLHTKAIDECSNSKSQSSGKFVLDNKGPTGSIDVSEEKTNTNKITLSLTCSDIVSNVGNIKYSLSLDQQTWSDWASVSGIINNYEVPLEEGEVIVSVKFKDELENESEIYSDSVILDLTPPTADIVYSAYESDGYVNTDVMVTLENIADNYSNTGNITVNETLYKFTTNGEYIFTLTDEVGNSINIKAKVNNIDKEKPVIQQISGNQNLQKSHNGNINVSDNITTQGEIKAWYQWTKSEITPSTYDSNWVDVENNTTVTKSDVDENWYLHVKAEDKVGNSSTKTSGAYLFDNTNPVGTVAYSTVNRTAQPVTATLSANETITITNTVNGTNKYTFNDNGEFAFELEDLAGNTASVAAEVIWIDKSVPSADVNMSTTDWTNENIQVTVSVPVSSRIEILDFDFGEISDYSIINELSRPLGINEMQYDPNSVTTNSAIYLKAYSVGENGKITFEIKDVDTQLTQEIEVTIDNVDKENPTYEVSLGETDPTNNDVVVNIVAEDNTNLPVQINKPANVSKIDNQYIISSNGTYNFKLVDISGNVIDVPVEISNIDKEAPKLSVTYSENEWTNQNVIATVISDEQITVLNNNGEYSKEFIENTTFEFLVKDTAGNTNSIVAEVNMIDKQLPDANIEYMPIDMTNTDVVVKITPNEEVEIISIDELDLVENKTEEFIVKTNGTYQFKLVDKAGNEKTKSIIITNIDSISPEITFTLSNEEITNQNVEIFLHGNETFEVLTVPENIIVIVDGIYSRYYAEDSGVYIFKVKDTAGNTVDVSVEITNIDKTSPILTLTYSAIDWTNKDVEVTLSADEEINVLNNEGSNKHNFIQNGKFPFQVRDLAGNENNITAIVENIDKQPANATVEFSSTQMVNTDVVVTLTPNESDVVIESIEMLTLVENSNNQFIVQTNGTYKFNIIDKAGNIYEKSININNIDKDSPEITCVLSTEEKTNKEVEIYLRGNEPFEVVSIPQGITTATDENGTFKYFAQSSGEYIFTVKDASGNEGNGIVNITNIDLIPPVLSMNYSATYWTNRDVIATVQADEDIIVLNNNKDPNYTFTQNGEFTFYVKDRAGNEGNIIANISIIDKKLPSATFKYSTTEITKENVKVTITGNEPLTSIVLEENLQTTTSSAIGAIGTLSSQEFTIETNGEYHFSLTDLAGNTNLYSICVVNIDKTPPVMTYTLTYDTPAGTKQVNQDGVIIKGPVINYGDDKETYQNSLITKNDIELNFNSNETYEVISIPQDITLNESEKYIIKDNGNYEFVVSDIAGNTATVEIVIDTIEKNDPNVTVQYSETEPTKNDVTATVVSTDGEYIRIINNYNRFKRVFSENEEYTFIVQDYAGNEVNVTATVDNIDRTPPQLELVYSTTDITNQNITVELSADEEITVKNNGGSEFYTFENNGDMRFVAEDLYENSTEIIATVDNIDKAAPVIVFTGNDNLSVVEGQEIDLLDDVTTSYYEDKKLPISITGNVEISKPGKYKITYEVTDEAGNTSNKEREVQVISKDNILLILNGINPDDVKYISGENIELKTYNTKGKYTILYGKGKLTKGQIKIKGEELNSNELSILENGWYTFLIYDQERNTRFYNIFITKY